MTIMLILSHDECIIISPDSVICIIISPDRELNDAAHHLSSCTYYSY